MDELVRSHMPIIFRVAGRSAQNPGVDINDLIQTATEGLLVAINRWSVEKSDACGDRRAAEKAAATAEAAGTDEAAAEPAVAEVVAAQPAAPAPVHSSRLATYALWWMRIMLTNSVIDNHGIVIRAKHPAVRKALFAMPTAIRKLEISLPLSGNDVSRIAAYLGISETHVEEALIHSAGDVMLDEPIGDGSMLRGDVIADDKAEGERGILGRLTAADNWDGICDALMEMSPRDRFILVTRYLITPKWKLDRLSDTLKMSRERIRQIGCDGLARIRSTIGEAGAPHKTVRSKSVAALDALVARIEAASTSSDPDAIARLLREEDIAVRPARVPARPLALTAAE
jgi:DNA-directed RNA polymerase sigma subunit (sigma70/sigma32)